ncbi:1272_t:CDS:2, partial [Gigaspora rosea]
VEVGSSVDNSLGRDISSEALICSAMIVANCIISVMVSKEAFLVVIMMNDRKVRIEWPNEVVAFK